ncbi:uncharacterized protein PSFLO_00859 [Pseudozyma flocculosa]|uniref:Uncharacterized protein n=1 Tax=Pseudozyma flocculosa TaxID=84751 RepID=A0A5C3ESZ6_9BASI|nr:uncharacterized protein PSFLO_00859 [Pseudozyma flocculosa]
MLLDSRRRRTGLFFIPHCDDVDDDKDLRTCCLARAGQASRHAPSPPRAHQLHIIPCPCSPPLIPSDTLMTECLLAPTQKDATVSAVVIGIARRTDDAMKGHCEASRTTVPRTVLYIRHRPTPPQGLIDDPTGAPSRPQARPGRPGSGGPGCNRTIVEIQSSGPLTPPPGCGRHARTGDDRTRTGPSEVYQQAL